MGWDAYAVTVDGKGLFEYDWKNTRGGGLYIKDNVYARAFRNASQDVFAKSGTVDGLLSAGGLDCSRCAEEMQKLTGIDAWGHSLSIEEVQELTVTPYEPDEGEEWAYHSALEFIKVCQEQKLGIKFSW